MQNLSIIILAAGLGKRMKSTTPKVLHSLSGYPMIFHILRQAQQLSNDVHVVLFHQHERIEKALKSHFQSLHVSLQDFTNFPGTGGALMGVKPSHERVLILNGDMPLVTTQSLEPLLKSDADVVLSTFVATDPKGYGRVVTDENDNVIKIVEEKDATFNEQLIKRVNAGVYCFDSHFLTTYLPKLNNKNAQKEYYLTDLIALATNNNLTVKSVEVNEESFMGVNSKSQLAQAETKMQNQIKTTWMEKGVSMRLPETIFIDSEARFEGECILENGVSILGPCLIDSSHIKANSIIESSQIKNSSIGPLARIRPQSEIIDSHIGNFVEVKKSKLTGVKAGHLSYLGDAFIDEGTNVGCGTITCNYDGKAKHQTRIGKNVFIGSDTQLIAPVTIEDDVLIAAGSTITKNIQKGALAITRAPLRIKEGFFEKFFGPKGSK
jgi:bifunctional UDP-N-acetylglucosamine pyrophosphorylase/glucosamine-1-phosphate N-acetyltransferase